LCNGRWKFRRLPPAWWAGAGRAWRSSPPSDHRQNNLRADHRSNSQRGALQAWLFEGEVSATRIAATLASPSRLAQSTRLAAKTRVFSLRRLDLRFEPAQTPGTPLDQIGRAHV